MKKAATIKLSLRKLFIAILALGPLAILPSPVWAVLPTTGSYSVTNGSVSLSPSGTTATFTVSDRSVLVWGAGNFVITAGDTWSFSGLSSTGAVLNKIGYNATTGGLGTVDNTGTINGTLTSTGKVFVLANGALAVNSGAVINTAGGLVLSTLPETSDFSFTTQGNLSFSGISTGAITLGNAPTAVNVSGGGLSAYAGSIAVTNLTVSGDLLINQTTAGAAFLPSTAIIGSGNVTVVTNAGVIGNSTGLWTVANGTTSLTTKGNVAITVNNPLNDFKTLAVSAGTGTGGVVTVADANIITLGASSVGQDLIVAVGGTVDTNGIATSGAVAVKGNATFTSAANNSSISIGNGSSVKGLLNATTTVNASITFNGVGNLSLGTIAAGTGISSGVSITTNGVLTVGNNVTTTGDGAAGGAISLTGGSINQVQTLGGIGAVAASAVTTGGSISYTATTGNITTGNITGTVVTLNASAGSINPSAQLVGSVITTSNTTGTSVVNTSSTGSADLTAANALAAGQIVQFTGGNLTLNDVNAVVVGTTNATGNYTFTDSAAGVNATLSSIVVGTGSGTSAQNIVVGGVFTLNATNAAGNITDNAYSGMNITGNVALTTGSGAGTGGAITLNAARANGSLAPNVNFGSVSANTSQNAAVIIAETNDLNLGTMNATTLSAYSVSGNIIQSDKITTLTSTTARVAGAAATIVLGNTSNSFGTLSLQGGSDASANTSGAVSGTTAFGVTSSASKNITLTAKSGKNIALAATTTAGNLTVNAGGLISTTGALSVGNLTLNSTSTSATSIGQGAFAIVVTGNTSVTSSGNVALSGQANDFATVTINTAGDTSIDDINNLTVAGRSGGAVTARAGILGIASTWNLILDNLTVSSLAATAANGDAGTGNSGTITQVAGSMLHVENQGDFVTNNGNIVVANVGNSVGRVQLSTGGVSGTGGNGTITYQEDSTVKLGTINNTGSASITALTGSIIEDPSGTNVYTNNGTLTLNAANGAVTIGGTTLTTGTTTGNVTAFAVNAPGGAVALKSTGANVTLSTINANSLAVNVTAGNLLQSNPLWIYGTANFSVTGGNLTLTNNSNNFGPIILSEGTVSKSISINESGTMNLRTVAMQPSATGNFTATSVNADIISSGFGGVKPGGTIGSLGTGVVTLVATNGNITVGDATTDFPTSGGVVFNAKNVSLSVLGNSVLTLGAVSTSSVATTLTVTSAIGSIANAGNIVVSGNASFTTGNGNISLNQSGDQFGGLKFSGNQVNVIQSNSMNILTGSSAIGASNLASTGNITVVNSGSGGVASFGNTVSLIASGTIILPKLISVGGTLTVNAAGAKDLSALSLAGDLSSKTPVNLGTGAYSAPQP